MTLQLPLAVTLLIGLPLLLLAVGVLAHAYLLSRPRGGAIQEAAVEAMVADSVEQLLVQLRSAPAPIEASVPLTSAWTTPQLVPAMAPTPAPLPAAMPAPPHSVFTSPSGSPLVRAVALLATEGLSDRSIARRLSVGIEEVRAARAPLSTPR